MLLPGDPRRALLVAQHLLESPKMFNTRRGLWGYTGRAADGELVTVQATGMGGPSAAIVVSELVALGARTLIRIGTCGALDPSLALGTLTAVRACLAADGTSRALGVREHARPDGTLTDALLDAGLPGVLALSTDLFYDADGDRHARERGAQVIEMETATIFALAARHGVRAAAVLGVTDNLAGERARIDDDELERLGVRVGEAGLAALIAAPAPA